MFSAIQKLLAQGDALNLLIVSVGDELSVSVLPKVGQGKDVPPGLKQPLQLRGTPAELNEGFAAAVSTFAEARKSLAEQVKATEALLKEQAAASAKKAVSTVTAKNGGDIDDDGDDDEVPTSPAAAAPSQGGQDAGGLGANLFDLAPVKK